MSWLCGGYPIVASPSLKGRVFRLSQSVRLCLQLQYTIALFDCIQPIFPSSYASLENGASIKAPVKTATRAREIRSPYCLAS